MDDVRCAWIQHQANLESSIEATSSGDGYRTLCAIKMKAACEHGFCGRQTADGKFFLMINKRSWCFRLERNQVPYEISWN